MAHNVRRVPDAVLFALVAANNQRLTDTLSTTFFHLDRTPSAEGTDYTNPSVTRLSITAANATDGPTAIVLANAIKTAVNIHFPDTIAHDTAVSASIATATATDTATGVTLGNALKSAYNTHLSAASVHFNNDSTNTTAAANATDAATLVTLVNEIKGDFNAHVASAPAGTYINVVPA